MVAVLKLPGVAFEIPPDIVVIGLLTGLTYALLALGLTLVYKTSRVLNFAHGEMGALPAIIIPVLVINHGVSYWLALPGALLLSVAIGAGVELGVIRRLRKASRLVALVATIGVAQLLFFANILIPKRGDLGANTYPTPFEASVSIGSIRLGSGQLLILGLVPLVAIALSVFFRRSKVGRASRAAAENIEAAQLAGVPVARISVMMWALAGLLAGLAAILVGPTRSISTQSALGPSLLLRALGAAMLGGLTSMPAVFAAGVGIGVIEALMLWNYPTGGNVELVLFGTILVSLLARRGLGQLARGAVETSWSLAGGVADLNARLAAHPRVKLARRAALLVALALAALFPVPLSTPQRFFMIGVLVFALMGLSLVVLTGYAGQISLGQFAFVALGAVVGGRLFQLGYPHATGMLYATLAGGLAALIVGLPALRLRGLFLAVTTLGFAVASSAWMFNQSWLVNTSGGFTSLRIPRPVWFGVDFESELNYYWLCLAILVAVAAAVARLRRTGVGRALLAVRDNELSAATFTVSPRKAKLTAFVLSGMIAALAGYLYGGLLGTFSQNPQETFGAEESLGLVAMVIFGGVTTITGAILGAFWVRGMPYLFGANIGLLSSGIGLLLVLLIVPGGLASIAFSVRDRVARWLARDVAADEEAPPLAIGALAKAGEAPVVEDDEGAVDVPIAAEGISVSYGGNQALRDVTLHANNGEILGLMGPNGAGKTTLVDVLSGQLRPNAGRVLLKGVDVTDLSPQVRALGGLGRTFQQARLFDDLSVGDAVKVALERVEPSEVVPSLLGLPPSRRAERRKDVEAVELLELLELHHVRHRRVAELSTGTRRFLELGCVVALGSDVVLLDEPTAGFAQQEVEVFRPVLRQLRDHLGATMVVIDHDVPMMMGLVDRLYVLVSGEVIAEGSPDLLRTDERVIHAYLGTNEATIGRSGGLVSAAGSVP